eukprot:bmy_18496T0
MPPGKGPQAALCLDGAPHVGSSVKLGPRWGDVGLVLALVVSHEAHGVPLSCAPHTDREALLATRRDKCSPRSRLHGGGDFWNCVLGSVKPGLVTGRCSSSVTSPGDVQRQDRAPPRAAVLPSLSPDRSPGDVAALPRYRLFLKAGPPGPLAPHCPIEGLCQSFGVGLVGLLEPPDALGVPGGTLRSKAEKTSPWTFEGGSEAPVLPPQTCRPHPTGGRAPRRPGGIPALTHSPTAADACGAPATQPLPPVTLLHSRPHPKQPADLAQGAKAKAVLPKKEKLKLRRERWLQSKLPLSLLGPCPGLARSPLWVVWGPGRGGLRCDEQAAPRGRGWPCHPCKGPHGLASTPDPPHRERRGKLLLPWKASQTEHVRESYAEQSTNQLSQVQAVSLEQGEQTARSQPAPGVPASSGSAGWESGPSVAEGSGRALVLLGPLSLTPYPPSSEIEATRLAEQKRMAARRRRATVVVGDLQPLRDALPELLELQTAGQREEERTRFRELLASPAYRASPLQAIGRQLAQQMRLEGGGQC